MRPGGRVRKIERGHRGWERSECRLRWAMCQTQERGITSSSTEFWALRVWNSTFEFWGWNTWNAQRHCHVKPIEKSNLLTLETVSSFPKGWFCSFWYIWRCSWCWCWCRWSGGWWGGRPWCWASCWRACWWWWWWSGNMFISTVILPPFWTTGPWLDFTLSIALKRWVSLGTRFLENSTLTWRFLSLSNFRVFCQNAAGIFKMCDLFFPLQFSQISNLCAR